MLDGVVLAVVLLICFLLGILWLVVRPFTRVVDYEESYLKLEFRGLCAPLFTIIFYCFRPICDGPFHLQPHPFRP